MDWIGSICEVDTILMYHIHTHTRTLTHLRIERERWGRRRSGATFEYSRKESEKRMRRRRRHRSTASYFSIFNLQILEIEVFDGNPQKEDIFRTMWLEQSNMFAQLGLLFLVVVHGTPRREAVFVDKPRKFGL